MISESEIIELIKKAEEGPTLDYKEDLPLDADGDKAQFVKDVISLANSGETAHIVVGVEDGTGRPVGLKTSHNAEQLNQILKDKCDPPISIEFAEKNILGYQIGIIEIKCANPPYIVSVPDKYGGKLSTSPNKSFHIQRGTVYVRNYNMNQGAKRADLDKIYDKIKYVSLQADLQLNNKVSIKKANGFKEVHITFTLENSGEVVATDIYVWIQFKNVKEILKCDEDWGNISDVNENKPTIQLLYPLPVIKPVEMECDGATVKVSKNAKQIKAKVIIGAVNMRTKEGDYVISLKEKG
jgi:hypothetical protein